VDIDGVFSGGGMKAIAFIGALQQMEESGFTFRRVAGTSAGALLAALVASGYSSGEIHELVKTTEFLKFLDTRKSIIPFPFLKWLRVYWKMGMYKGDAMEKWIRRKLKEKGVETFADLPEGSLKIVASDLSKGRILVLPDDLRKYGVLPEKFSVARAVRMSSSLPFFYEPIFLYNQTGDKSVVVDGGVLSNFPLWLFDQPRTRPVIGFQLSPKIENQPTRNIHNAVELYQALFTTMKEAHDARYIMEHQVSDIVFIPVDHVATTSFDLDAETKTALIELGKKRTEKFLRKWTY
jgi:NTE family protein